MQKWSTDLISNTGGRIGFVLGFYNSMLGNYDYYNDYVQNSQVVNSPLFANIVYFILSVYLQVVMMNLLISFLGDTYGDVNSKKL